MSDTVQPETRSITLAEFAVVGLVAFLVIAIGWRLSGDNTLVRQLIVWLANIMMLATIWLALRRRGQNWSHLGLQLPTAKRRPVLRTFLQSLLVLVIAMAGFLFGSMVGINIFGEQAGSDMSGYQYLQGNLPMLLLALAGVYIASSFGEEVIYRGYLMTRVAEMFGNTKGAWRIAVLISALIFGLIHFAWGAFGIVQTTFMGLALAIAYLYVDRNLWALVLAHAYLDTILLVQIYLAPVTGSPA